MNCIRKCFDSLYDISKPILFFLSKHDPHLAHELFVEFSRLAHRLKLESILLDNDANYTKKNVIISNAAGFNKNGFIPPLFLRYLGFDRVVIGTVTGEPWKGNPRPHTLRLTESELLINWMGLPGMGAGRVRRRLMKLKHNDIPITINIAPTPNKRGDDALRDLEKTVDALKTFSFVDRFELNISCPNTEVDRNNYHKELQAFITALQSKMNDYQKLYIKISPDLLENEIDETVSVIRLMHVDGIVTTNTTTQHNYQQGGASGDLLYERSFATQKLFYEKLKNTHVKIIACGGISSLARLQERINFGSREVQIFTSLIFQGPRLLRDLRKII